MFLSNNSFLSRICWFDVISCSGYAKISASFFFKTCFKNISASLLNRSLLYA
ncbi:hypothetical protein P689_119129 [Candidatus Riesia pediculischaeffi PTSU]|uniref:Uncharacterized protein n=1 Tax=Candidatus Riesia pediculischaeffi PTSU TaxID=1401651 RepID=A0A0C1V8I7_9ENTR|nr:hypothetical protein P689_119129 [Candidatus Riesia pediculischaeffi PTSU]